jgi:anti-sigma regulatory factor (Ser/Thr protein kinase)
MTTPVVPFAARPAHSADGAHPARSADSVSSASSARRPASQWTLHSFLELGALDGAVPSARLHARHVLREWELAALADDVELVVSELATNGVQASRALAHAAIRLWLASDGVQVVISVWDASPEPPVRLDAAENADGGRGLLLVEAVSKEWGWFPAEPGGPWADGHRGKVVWAVLS